MAKNIIVAGGGAAGLMAAIAAAIAAADVGAPETITVLEKMERVGKKILATGNGRCNLSNWNACAGHTHYHGEAPEFAERALNAFNPEKTLAFFQRWGLMCKTEDDGRIYPMCNQASAVLDILRGALDHLGVHVRKADVSDISIQKKGFAVSIHGGERLACDKVIVATGGRAAPALGGSGGGYALMEKMGHSITPVYPALVQLRSDSPWMKRLKGIRARGGITLQSSGRVLIERVGELQFTGYGVSGIPALDASGFASNQKTCEALLDFAPDMTPEDLNQCLASRAKALSHVSMDRFFIGFFHRLMGEMFVKYAGVPLTLPAADLSSEQMSALVSAIKCFTVPIAGTNGFSEAQVTGGGVRVQEMNPSTMESKKQKGLYAAGELLDIYGDCGGYNLQWAWSSGYAAGVSAALD
ncbi:MAG: NAD(P)/FAD-dependent oxidoreductase [Clostridiales bacterium]|jgi:predicted Rossmann fold flavoprotein|nr:NAD(P)/FAD-dependent oxidoreductase [Clostridiales bacterium]